MNGLLTWARYAKSLARWLADARLVWLLFVVLVAAVLAAFWPSPTEQRVRVSGWLLELFGLFTVAWGLRETRRQFERPSLTSLASAWWARRPRISSNVVAAGASISLGAATASGRGYGWHEAQPNASVEERLHAVEANLTDINARVNTALRELDEEVQTRREGLNRERSAREASIGEVQQKLESAQTDGLHVSAMGVIWLAVGLTLSTIPVELIALMK